MKTAVPPFIDKSEIRALIPHAGSMCLLDRVIAWDQQSILCTSETHRDPANPLRRKGHLAIIHAFEYAAQAVAVHGGLRAHAAGAVAPPGYLAALRQATVHAQQFDGFTSPLQVEARQLFADTANSVYECRVSTADMSLAHGRVTIILRDSGKKISQNLSTNEHRRASQFFNPQDSLDLMIRSDHPSLPGHFPGEPIIPGVVILDEVLAAMSEGRKAVLTRINVVKFLAPSRPEEVFTIFFSAGSAAQFECRAGERVIVEGHLEMRSDD